MEVYLKKLKNKKITIQSILFIVLLIEIFMMGIITRGSGDTGIYVSNAYQYSIGETPFIDFFNFQGIAYPIILSIPIKLFGDGLLGQRFFFILLSISCVYLFYKMLLSVKINIQDNTKLKIILLIIGILSFDFWNMAIRLGTKSSLVILLLMLSIFFLAKYIKKQKLIDLVITCFFSATLIAIKTTFLSIFLTFNIIIIMYGLKSEKWLKPLIIYNLCFFTFIAIWHIEILLSPNGINQYLKNFYVAKQNYDLEIYSIGFKIRQAFMFLHYLILKYLPFILILNFTDLKNTIVNLYNNREKSLIVISLLVSIIYLLSNVFMLFPGLATPHYDVLFPLFLFIIIYLSIENILKVKYTTFVFMFLLLFCVNFGLAFMKGPLHYGRFTIIRPSMLKYEYGNNDVVKFLNEKENEGYKDYLYIGRRNHHVITTKLKEKPKSAAGTIFLGREKEHNLNEIISDQLHIISISNMNNILENNSIIVVQRNRLLYNLKRRELDYYYQQFIDDLNNAGYNNQFNNHLYDVYVK